MKGRWRALGVAAAIAVAAGGCSPGDHNNKPTPTPTPHRSAAELRQQAQAKLTKSPQVKLHWTGAVKKNMAPIKTEPGIKDSHAYVLEAACAGTGSLWLDWERISPDTKLLPAVYCDGAAVRLPFTGNDLEMFFFAQEDIDPPNGILAWQIIPATH